MSASAGRVLILPKGTYNASTTYHLLDLIEYNNASYICKQTSLGHLPTDTTYWQKLVDGVVDQTYDDTSTRAQSGTAVAEAISTKADTSSLTDGSVTKIGTGNVGSSTQPVYINGGVPTAIGKNATFQFTSSQSVGWYTLATFPTNASIALRWSNGVQDVFDGFIFINAGFYNSGGNDKVSLTWIGHNWRDSCFPKLRITKDTGTGYAGTLALDVYLSAPGNAPKSRIDVLYDSSQQIELKTTPTAAVYSTVLSETDRKKEDSIITTGNIRSGITTGTASLNSSYIDSGSVSYVKSGNVVVVNMDGVHLKANVPTGTTLFSNLPKNAISRNRLWIDAALDTTHDNFLCNMTNSGILALAGAQAMPTGRYLYGSFTYITND